MRIAVGLFGILIGLGNLMYVGIFGGMIGSGAEWIGSFGPEGASLSEWGKMIQLISWLAPLLTIIGGIVTFSSPSIGGIILGISTCLVWYLLGIGFIGKMFVFPMGAAAILAFLSPPPRRTFTSNTFPAVNRTSSWEESRNTNNAASNFDRNKWNALVRYDEDIALIVERLKPLGTKWVDEFGAAYLALNDKNYLLEIERKIVATAKDDAEKKKILKLRAEEERKLYLQEKERLVEAVRKQVRLWQGWIYKHKWQIFFTATAGIVALFIIIWALQPGTPRLGDFEINLTKNATEYEGYNLDLFISGHKQLSQKAVFKPEVKIISEKPHKNCKSMVAITFSGGAHCCTTSVVCTVCSDSSQAITIGFDHSEIDDMRWFDVNGDGTDEIEAVDWSFAYYSADELSLCFACSPWMARILVFEKGAWRPDHPGEFKTYYENLAQNTVINLQQLKTQPQVDDEGIVANAIQISYYEYMATGNIQEVYTDLQNNLPVSWQKVRNKVISDIQKTAITFNPIKEYGGKNTQIATIPKTVQDKVLDTQKLQNTAIPLITNQPFNENTQAPVNTDVRHNQQDKAKEQSLPVPAPLIKVGDNYVYETINQGNQINTEPTFTTKKTVISSSDEIVFSTMVISRKKARERKLYFNSEWNLIRTRNSNNGGLDYSPPIKYYEFPLYPGKTWQQTATETDIKTKKTRTHTITGTVEQWEDINVPAGTFHAIRVNLNTEVYDPSTGERVSGTDTSWYVPEVNRSVKSVITGKYGEQITQLLRYELK